MDDFCNMYNLQNLIKDPTCYKNPENPTCVDLILTNKRNFKHSKIIETGLSDFHLMTVSVMNLNYQKLKPKVISYRNYQNYTNEKFREVFINRLQLRNNNIRNY